MTATGTPGMQVKTFGSFEVKNEAIGEVEAIVATLNVVDRDAEVITKDAITSGSKVKMSAYAHDIVGGLFGGGGAMPVGKGAIYIEKDKAVFRGKVFVATQRGRDVMEVLKEMGPDQEWSFGFRVIGSEIPDEEWRKRGAQLILTKLEVFEVSPVVLGAGIGTGTVAAKASGAAAAETLEAEFLRICERAALPAGLPLPERFQPVVAFAAKRLGLYPSDIPPVKVVAPGAIRDEAIGCYLVKEKCILVAAGLSDEEMQLTLFHEMVHRYEDLKGWWPDERFACSMERDLATQWSEEFGAFSGE